MGALTLLCPALGLAGRLGHSEAGGAALGGGLGAGLCAALVYAAPRARRPFALPVGGGLLVAGLGDLPAPAGLLTLALGIFTLSLFVAATRALQGRWLDGGPPG
jgi:hypothetical protein